ncbi:MAG: DNA polymerase III subunit alpha, partial [Armatimonadetes bacterium]|nr:DNA polymerase III subunit alpha [Armatimonadota bacterium]
ILKETFGVIVYQDQVLKIVQAIGGFSLGQADILRRAMGKKQAKYMEEQKVAYMKGAMERGVKEKVAEQIFGEIEPFAGYAFNGAHAACYAMVAYQTAYLKANYPAEYLAALMGAYIDNTEKVVNTIEECERLGVTVKPPCVNESAAEFSVDDPQTIRFGLMAIKNVGKAPIDAILTAREKGGRFVSLEDFCNRVFAEGLTSKSVIEMLIKAGTFAGITTNRRALLDILDDCTAAAARGAKDSKAGLISLWGDEPSEDNAAVRGVSISETATTDFSRGELLGFEKELLGIYLTDHPVKPFEMELKRKFKTMRIDELKETQPNQDVMVGGMITAVRTVFTKEGKQMLMVTLEDTTANIGVTCFTKIAAEFGKWVIPNAIVAVRGRAQHRERIGKGAAAETEEGGGGGGSVQIEVIASRIDQIVPDAMAADAKAREVYVRVDSSSRTILRMVADAFRGQEGGSPLFFRIETPSGEYTVRTKMMVSPDEVFLDGVRKMLGGGGRRVWVE